MAATKYTKSITTDFTGLVDPYTSPNLDRFTSEIRASSIVTALDYINMSGDVVDIWFKDVLSSGDQTTLETLCNDHTGEPLPNPTDSNGYPIVTLPVTQGDGEPIVGVGPRLAGSETLQSSHNYCDKTTWYGDSVGVTDEELTDSGDGLTWNSAHTYWVDVYHGKFMEDDELIEDYPVIVKVNSVEKTMRPPFATDWTQGGDYYVDFTNGDVIFQNDQSGNTVTATYHYATTSGWYLAPKSGKALFLEEAELNCSIDVIFNDTVVYEIEVDIGGGTWVAVADAKYKTVWQMIQECRGNHPVIPAFGGTARGIQHNAVQLPFIYVADRELKSSDNVRIHVHLEDDIEFGGEHGSITFYCLSRDE